MQLPPSPNPDETTRVSKASWLRCAGLLCLVLLGYGYVHWAAFYTGNDGGITFSVLPLDPLHPETALSPDNVGDYVNALQGQVDEYEHKMNATLWPFLSSCPYQASILYLVKDTQVRNLLLSLGLLLRNVPFQCAYPIVLFHDGEFKDPEAQRMLRDKLMLVVMSRLEVDGTAAVARRLEALNGLEFVELEFTQPEGISSNVTEVDPVFPNVWPGYHQMCLFFFAEITDHPRIRQLDYYFRLDTDSFLLKPLAYDPIHKLYEQNRSYGFVDVGTDPPFVTEGFFPFVRSYADEHAEVRERMDKNGWEYPDHERPWVYQNNFEIMHVPSFRRPEIREWVESVLSDPLRIFKYRWGDAPLRYATVQMFFDVAHDAEQFCDITYYHQGLHNSCTYRKDTAE